VRKDNRKLFLRPVKSKIIASKRAVLLLPFIYAYPACTWLPAKPEPVTGNFILNQKK